MKKLLIAAASLFSVTFIHAESYTVKSVTGLANIQTGSENWVELSEGKTVTSENIISTSLNSILVLSDENGKDIKIKANQNGSVDILVNAASTPAAGIKRAKITTANSKNAKGTVAAFSRASEAKEDIDWDE